MKTDDPGGELVHLSGGDPIVLRLNSHTCLVETDGPGSEQVHLSCGDRVVVGGGRGKGVMSGR